LAATRESEQELRMYMPLAAAPTWLSFSLIMLVNPEHLGGSLDFSQAPLGRHPYEWQAPDPQELVRWLRYS
jgi:hypothetical protein